MNKIGFVTFATPDYEEKYFKQFEESVKRFCPFAEVILLRKDKLPQPLNTFLRYWWLREAIIETIHDKRFTHVYMIDVDTKFVNDVKEEEIVGDLVAVQHCGYVNQPPFVHPMGYFRTDTQSIYYGGGFIGGRTDIILKLCEEVSLMTESELSLKRIPVWNDETLMNFALNNGLTPTKVLDPSFHYPDHPERYIKEIWGRDYTPKLMLITK